MNIRTIAARKIAALLQGNHSLTELLAQPITPALSRRDNALLQELCYGVCRWYFRLTSIVRLLLHKPLKSKDCDIYSLLLIGLYQLIYLRIPAHAAVAETVNAATELKKAWAKNLVNATLRQFQRQQQHIEQQITQDLEAQYSHPHWLLKMLQDAWPSHWQAIVDANNQYPPMNLRVNLRKIHREDYLKKIIAQNLAANISPLVTSGITLQQAIAVNELPGFSEGEVSVQDTAAQIAAYLLDLKPQQRVLDACAAPGGKTTHILETQPALTECIAIDNDARRLTKIQDNLDRLKLSATLVCADATKWQNQQAFDRILLDAPCSSTGVIRRHPDIKILRCATDIVALAQQQQMLLDALWPMLKPGGLLVYATCSVLPQENEQVIHAFLTKQTNAKEKKIVADWGKTVSVGKQIFPEQNGSDGFYYCCLEKR